MLKNFFFIALSVYFVGVRILTEDQFSVWVYANDHPPPHCHIRRNDGDEIVVTLPLMEPLYGGELTKKEFQAIQDNIDTLLIAWEAYNPDLNRN